MILNLINSFKSEFSEKLYRSDYLLADTRIPWVSLYDHLILTAGFAAALAEELLRRGRTAMEICGIELSPSELRALARLCGLLHDLGKARIGEMEYRFHVQRSVEYAREWLAAKGVEEHLQEIILGVVARHHLRDGPQTILEKLVCLADSYASAGDRPELARAYTATEFQRLAGETLRLEQELFGADKPVCLLLGDTDAIKSYVYETSTLPEIRGASEILQELEENVRGLFTGKLAEEALIYCGGGGFLVIVPASQAEELKQEIERLYLEKTGVATITVVSSDPLGYADIGRGLAPYDDVQVRALSGRGVAADLLFSHFEALLADRTKRKNFGELVSALTGRLQQQKRAKATAPFLETLPVHRRCESCGKRAAEVHDDARDEWICVICSQKREHGRGERREFVKEFVRWVYENKRVEIPEKTPDGRPRFPEDLDTLAGSDGRIALFYADGNNMGDLLQLMPSPASYRHFSRMLEQATRDALFSAIWAVFDEERLKDPGKPLPFEIIALGGDDIVVIVPARYGWALAVKVLEAFEQHPGIEKLQKELQGRVGNALRRPVSLSLSAGLAIADVKYPVSFLFSLAEGLLKEAKKLAREVHTSTLCHLWLRAPVISERADVLLSALYARQRMVLTARPYTAEQARRLAKLVHSLQQLPKAQRHSLAEALEKGVHVSLNYALYQAARQKERGAQLRKAFQELGNLLEPAMDGFWFWRWTDEGWKTALLDALELIELGAVLDIPREEHYALSATD
ncbi:Cas10/Cmr2 second palm domain-containing protein [Thermoflexus hugenholtzii]|jgi:HD domain.|uniref:HD domain-containing protein n=1 Tax=Thermoflexus hugenholtzii JAD2 TaxID=877466 RepID=A0A212RME2_9CHLR|nr:HD domain-containing protein [Thermoflexus hugenholtzii]SNB73725.1 HD domain-containing protein [Thermoflexus hugenholtzii JAD2]